MEAVRRTRKPRADGERSRRNILATAGALASTDGLEGLSIGRLAERASMSKSGLYAHFGSKEELQLATIEAAEEVFRREVLDPAEAAPEGIPRILATVDAYLSYLERRVFPGGCFFAAVGGELAASEGAAADRIRELNEDAAQGLTDQLRIAQRNGELDPGADVDQLAFEIDSLMLGAHASTRLGSGPDGLRRAREAVEARLRG